MVSEEYFKLIVYAALDICQWEPGTQTTPENGS